MNDDETFIWLSLVQHYGLPALPDWGGWVISQLHRDKRVRPLLGFGYEGVAVGVTRKQLLMLLRKGLRSKQLLFPPCNAPIEWPEIRLIKATVKGPLHSGSPSRC